MRRTSHSSDPAPRVKLCPQCGRSGAADRIRCSVCWADVADVAPLSRQESEARLALEREADERRAVAEQREERRVRLLRAVAAVALVVIVGWWAYGAFLVEPPPLPAAASRLTLSSTPGAWASSAGGEGATRSTQAGARLRGDVDVVDLGAAPAVEPVADGSTIYLVLSDGRLVAVDAENSAERWTITLQNPTFAAPVLAGGRAFVPLRQGVILAVAAETGEVLWESEGTPSAFLAAPIVADGTVYALGTRSVHGFDAETGATLWSREVGRNSSQVGPVVAGNYVAVAGAERVHVFDRSTGEQTYFFEFVRARPSALVSSGGVIYALYGRFASAFESDARRPWWDRARVVWAQLWVWGMAPEVPPAPSLWNIQGTPREAYPAALSADQLVVADASGELIALDRWTGEQLWAVAQRGIVSAPIATADGVLLAHADRLALIDSRTGHVTDERLIDELRAGEQLHSLALTAEGLYLLTDAGRLIILR